MEVTQAAVETGMWMLYEVDQGRTKLTYRPKRRRPIKEYLRLQRRFAQLTARDVQQVQRQVDGAWRGFR
jgi:pyruvate ferredoxin oxidoreductase beta subunit